ncbi:MAG: hypothetical protein R3A48_13435 [Polyangiales bacterium]
MPVVTAECHAARLLSGEAVLAAAVGLDTRPIAAKLAQFRKAHSSLSKASAALATAEQRLVDAQRDVADFDNDQDAAVGALAASLVTVGQPRLNPFRKLSKYAPGRMQQIGYAAEARALLELTARARKLDGLNNEVQAAAREAERCARALLAAVAVAEHVAERAAAARDRRDALCQPWETALAALRRAVRAQEQNGASGLFDALFRPATRRAKSVPPKRAEA